MAGWLARVVLLDALATEAHHQRVAEHGDEARLSSLLLQARRAISSGPLQRVLAFIQRHRWSLPLSLFAAVAFGQLADEVREDEVAAFDALVIGVVQGWRGELDGVMLGLTVVGGGLGMAVLSLAAIAVLVMLRRRRQALFLVVSSGGALLLNTLLKLAFQRARPDAPEYLIALPSSFSFPSGHAMASMGCVTSLLVVLYVSRAPRTLRWAALVLAALFIPGVALSRVYFGVHYPSDVIGGQLAAAAWVSAITGWFHPYLLPGEHAKTTPPGTSEPGA